MIRKFLVIAVVLCAVQVFGQKEDPMKLLDKVKAKFSLVKDYEVSVKVKIDVDFLKVPVTDALLYYKQPNKIRIKAEGFALLPREGLDFSPAALLKENYTGFYERDEVVDGIPLAVVKVIPLGDNGNVILSTLWIDKKELIVRKLETTTKRNGTFNIDLYYDAAALKQYPLPSSMQFTFDLNKVNIPKGFTGDLERDGEKKKKENKMTRGTVKITYSNYKVNQNLPDSIFEEKNKKK